ncbi:MAG: alpha-hydroxy-acid oxidizing protein, partial [Rugosibacter sp.]
MATPSATAPFPSINRARDYQALAKARLDPAIWQYLQEGSGDISVQDNQDAFATFRLLPRPLRNVQGGHTRLTLYGQELAHP